MVDSDYGTDDCNSLKISIGEIITGFDLSTHDLYLQF